MNYGRHMVGMGVYFRRNMRIFHLKMDIDTEMCMTYVTCTHMYNEGGEGSILRGPLRDNQLLHRLAIMKHLVDATRVCKESALVWNLSRLHSIASV